MTSSDRQLVVGRVEFGPAANDPVLDLCKRCGKATEAPTFSVKGRLLRIPAMCEDCAAESEAEQERREREERQAARAAAFEAMCPPLYRDTDPARLAPRFREAAERWSLRGGKGLGLVGPAGLGKSRAAWMALRRAAMDGARCHATTATAFARACADQFSDDPRRRNAADAEIHAAKAAAVWLCDDIGKQRMTDRAEAEFYDVLEHRTSHLRPTIWTANAAGADLRAMLSADRAEPILRRLVEFSEIVSGWKGRQR